MRNDSESGTPSCLANLSRMRARRSTSVVEGVARKRTMESSSIALTANVSVPVRLRAEGGESGGDQGRWNCPGGLSWKGFGKRSGVAMPAFGCFDGCSRPGL